MLFFVEPLTWRSCDNATVEKAIAALNTTVTDPSELIQLADKFLAKNATCMNIEGVNACKLAGGSCRTIMDGFYIEICVCLFVGLVSYFTILRGMARSLDALPLKAYRFRKRTSGPPPSSSNWILIAFSSQLLGRSYFYNFHAHVKECRFLLFLPKHSLRTFERDFVPMLLEIMFLSVLWIFYLCYFISLILSNRFSGTVYFCLANMVSFSHYKYIVADQH